MGDLGHAGGSDPSPLLQEMSGRGRLKESRLLLPEGDLGIPSTQEHPRDPSLSAHPEQEPGAAARAVCSM